VRLAQVVAAKPNYHDPEKALVEQRKEERELAARIAAASRASQVASDHAKVGGLYKLNAVECS
jgi:hypothetical protein